MTVEWKHDRQPAIGAEIAALRNLAAEATSDLSADEQLIAVSWGRTGRNIFTERLWATGLVLIGGGLYLILHEQWWLWAAMAIVVAAGLATLVGPGYGVLLTDRQLILVRTSRSRPPRPREAPAFAARGDVSATLGHGFFGTTVFLTLATPVTGTPLRLTFDSQYVPAATAIYLSLASKADLPSLRLPPPDGPALADSRTRAVLRRYRYGTWLRPSPGSFFSRCSLFWRAFLSFSAAARKARPRSRRGFCSASCWFRSPSSQPASSTWSGRPAGIRSCPAASGGRSPTVTASRKSTLLPRERQPRDGCPPWPRNPSPSRA